MTASETRRRHGPPPREITRDGKAALARIVKAQRAVVAAEARAKEAQQSRTDAYLAARALDPPVTFRAIADAVGLTEAAVMSFVKKASARKK